MHDVRALIDDDELAFLMSQRLVVIRRYVIFVDQEFRDLFDDYTEQSLELQERHLEMTDDERAVEFFNKSIEWGNLVIDEVFTQLDNGNEEEALTNLRTKVVPLSREIMDILKQLSDYREETSD